MIVFLDVDRFSRLSLNQEVSMWVRVLSGKILGNVLGLETFRDVESFQKPKAIKKADFIKSLLKGSKTNYSHFTLSFTLF